jgi:hypothetical protein
MMVEDVTAYLGSTMPGVRKSAVSFHMLVARASAVLILLVVSVMR